MTWAPGVRQRGIKSLNLFLKVCRQGLDLVDLLAQRRQFLAAFGSGPGRAARLHLIGAPFQIKVWEALLRAPMGAATTYTDLAKAVGAPRAQRAVGTAVGRNPISWLIPCHRALRTTGALGGYHWGLPVKRAMLAWETARVEGAEDAA